MKLIFETFLHITLFVPETGHHTQHRDNILNMIEHIKEIQNFILEKCLLKLKLILDTCVCVIKQKEFDHKKYSRSTTFFFSFLSFSIIFFMYHYDYSW